MSGVRQSRAIVAGAPDVLDRSLTVLGGSSPFTLALVEALRNTGPRFSAWRLILQGREQRALDLVARCAASRLDTYGWRVSSEIDRRTALDGCDIVVHQARYGGTEGRLKGEELAARYGTVADETLGPAALRTALASRADIMLFGTRVHGYVP